MKAERTFAWQSLVATLALNALMLAGVYYLAKNALLPTLQLLPVLGVALLATLALWAVVRALARRLVSGVQAELGTAQPQSAPTPKPPPAPAPAPSPRPDASLSEAGAVQMLAILQRQGRLVDFLQEDLGPFADAQIGAAVRSVHAGCKQALDEHVTLEAIYAEAEGDRVTVEPGFDAYAVRLSGSLSGEPPFTGTLRHRGWRAAKVELPQQVDAERDEHIVAAAEVEI
jgi:hypothetical protein